MTEAIAPTGPNADLAIVATGLNKVYRVYHGQARGWLKAQVLPFVGHRFYQEYPAVTDVNLRIPRGKVMGILGRNGSGKSTLLRLLAGISTPTSGRVEMYGRVRCLLATGVSFNPRFTGRQNILFGSAAMGIPVEVARARMDEIIEFSELGPDIDKPSMIYSAGMATKLAFAVAFQETPEILLLDEAMAAGDIFFQHKCDQRIREIVASGSTVVMATHSMAAIDELCTDAILLERGRIVADGPAGSVAERYRGMLAEAEAARPRELANNRRQRNQLDLEAPVWNTGQGIEVLHAEMCDGDGVPSDSFDHGTPMELRIRLRGTGELPRLRFTLDLFSEDLGVRVANTGTEHLSADSGELSVFPPVDLRGEHELVLRIPRNELGSGLYSWTLSIRPFDPKMSTVEFLRRSRVVSFRSLSFPGHPLGHLRKMLTEPAVQCELRTVDALPQSAKASQ